MAQKPKGFTVMELLTVLVIIAVLSALLFPVIARSRVQASTVVCAENQHQIHAAILLYQSDNDGVYPSPLDGELTETPLGYRAVGGRPWPEIISPYIKAQEFPSCPAVELPFQARNNRSYDCGYAYNLWLSRAVVPQRHIRLQGDADSAVRYPSTMILLGDARAGIIELNGPDTATSLAELQGTYSVSYLPYILKEQVGALRHHEGANYEFVDGHNKWLKPDQVQTNPQNDGFHPSFAP